MTLSAKGLEVRLRLLKQCQALRNLHADIALWEPLIPARPEDESYPQWRCSIPIPIDVARRLLDECIAETEAQLQAQMVE
jgi:hypothetical protein